MSRWAVDALAWRASGRTTIGKAINGGYDLLEAKSNRYDRISLVPLRRTNARADPGAVHGRGPQRPLIVLLLINRVMKLRGGVALCRIQYELNCGSAIALK